jgi:hypothetical protein
MKLLLVSVFKLCLIVSTNFIATMVFRHMSNSAKELHVIGQLCTCMSVLYPERDRILVQEFRNWISQTHADAAEILAELNQILNSLAGHGIALVETRRGFVIYLQLPI